MARNAGDQTEVLGGGDPKRQPQLGRYRLERRIGQGGMAEVFLARAEGPGGFEKQVVIKRIRPQLVNNERFVEMFLREGRLLAGLDHPNIVRIFELDVQDGEYFLALEYLDGLSLREVMERYWQAGRSVPLEPVLRIFADAALGLAHAHALKEPSGAPANLVHRDVSPDNIFVTTTSVTKVLDFGIAKREGLDVLTQTGELKGKIQFMAPEALRGDTLDARADLWSFGVTLYWACAGRRPFDGVTDVHTIKGILEDPPPPLRQHNTRLPHVVEEVVLSCLEKDRSKRVKSASQLHETLSALLIDLPRGAPTPAELVAAARALPTVDHEITPRTAAVAPAVPWPDRTMPVAASSSGGSSSSIIGGRGKNAVPLPAVPSRAADQGTEGPTKVARKFQGSLPPTDKVKSKLLVPPSEPPPPVTGEFEGATELVASSALHTTDEHKRVMQSTEHAEQPEATTGPERVAKGAAAQQGFGPPSDPVIDVERELRSGPTGAARGVSSNAPTLPHVALDSLAGGAPAGGASAGGSEPDIHDQHTQAVSALAPWPEVADIDIPPPRPVRGAPMVAGVVTALALVVGALFLTGTLGRVVNKLLGRPVAALDAGAAQDAGAAARVDAATIAVHAAGDAGTGSSTDASASAARDAGATAPTERTLRLVGPDHVEWLGPTAEPLGVGRITVTLASEAHVIFAKDQRRGATSRVILDDGQSTVEYARLPKGKLTVRTRAPAEVFVGAERLGRTPLAPKELVAGRYEVRLVSKKRTKVVPVEVRAGKTASVSQDLR
ncbi:MAG: serine/threonine protein kinase [Deltaproteobacteria bacterium]|nr:serine/threonine protein kinase [Deltaproteobacteria bacterium]